MSNETLRHLAIMYVNKMEDFPEITKAIPEELQELDHWRHITVGYCYCVWHPPECLQSWGGGGACPLHTQSKAWLSASFRRVSGRAGAGENGLKNHGLVAFF